MGQKGGDMFITEHQRGFPNPMFTMEQKGGMFIMEHDVWKKIYDDSHNFLENVFRA